MRALLKALYAEHDRFHARFALSSQFHVELWECPGAWLDDASLDRMVDEMRRVAESNNPGKPIPLYGPLLKSRAEQAKRIVTMIYDTASGAPVAFNALRYLDLQVAGTAERVVHLGLTYIDPSTRGKRLSHVLYGLANFFLFFKSGMRTFWVSSVTQVPAVVGLLANHYDNVYPSPYPRARQTFTHLQLVRAIMAQARDAFGVGEEATLDEATQVIRNAYTGGSDELKKTFDESAKHSDPVINEYCEKTLDYDRGDDVLQLATWGVKSTIRFLRLKIPRSMAVQAMYRAASLVFVGLLVPIVRWLNAPSTVESEL